MHLLIIHHEAEYFAGAEKVLGYYLQGLMSSGYEVSVAAVRESRMADLIPPGVTACWVPANSKFSLGTFFGQAGVLRRFIRSRPVDIVHGWAARDWELTAVTGRLSRRPTAGTLHDHPQAPFISRARQRLMAWCGAYGLNKIVCVSEAVRQACRAAGYRDRQLEVAHNGLPPSTIVFDPARTQGCFRLGYLGQFSERKGLRGLFEILDELARHTALPWEMALAGDAQEPEGRKLVQALKERYHQKAWWPQVRWCGWVKRPAEFLASLDLLLCPSTDFDPFPTVLLEAGQMGVPVLAARVGGVAEIIEDGQTGWLFDSKAWAVAAERLQSLLQTPHLASEAGQRAKKRVDHEFAIGRMVADYLRVYSGLVRR